jgi:hypothetical protein
MAQTSRANKVKDFVKKHRTGIGITVGVSAGVAVVAELASYALTGKELFSGHLIPHLYSMVTPRTFTEPKIVAETVTNTVKTTVFETAKTTAASTTGVAPISPKVAKDVYDLKSVLDYQQDVGSFVQFVMESGKTYSSYINSQAVQTLLQNHRISGAASGGGTVQVWYNGKTIEAALYYGREKPLSITIEELQRVADSKDATDKIIWAVKAVGKLIYQTMTKG